MAKNSTEGNKARTARYRAGLAARGIRPVQLYAPENGHALLRQAAGLMSREQNPLEPRQALRQISGTNDPGQGHGDQDGRREVLAAAVAEIEAVRVELAEMREAKCQAERQVVTQAEAMRAAASRAEVAERAQALLADELQAAEAIAAEARAEAEGFRQAPGLRGRMVRWLARGAGKETKNAH